MSVTEKPTLNDLDLITEASDLLTLRDLGNVLYRILELAAKAVDADRATLLVYSEDGTTWTHILTGEDLSQHESMQVMEITLKSGLTGWVAHNREAVIIADTAQDERWYHFPDGSHPARSAIGVPLIYRDDLVGVVTLAHMEPDHFNTYHLRLMTMLANQAAIAIRNAQSFDRMNAQHQQLEAVLQAVPDTLLVLDQSGSVLLVSNAILEILNDRKNEQVVGQPITQLASFDSLFMPIQQLVEGRANLPSHQVWTFESRSARHERDFLVTVSMWSNSPRNNSGYVVVMKDITTLRKLGRFKDEMLRLVSHDLRTPLVLIIGYADLLSLDLADGDPSLQQYVQGIVSAADRMDKMLTDMLRVEKIKLSPLELHEELNLIDIITLAIQDVVPLATQKGITLQLDFQEEQMPPISGDRILLRQAMDNIVNNAIKYTPEGGEVLVRAYTEDARFHFVVKDNGVGIPKGDLPFVFESFYRGNLSTNKPIKGAGLGLSLVKNVIEQHGGRVWVESDEGQGSSFGFWLPII